MFQPVEPPLLLGLWLVLDALVMIAWLVWACMKRLNLTIELSRFISEDEVAELKHDLERVDRTIDWLLLGSCVVPFAGLLLTIANWLLS
jgi:hypothetical protein